MTFAKLCLGLGAALVLAGCDAAAGAAFGGGGEAAIPADLPMIPAGKFRYTETIDGKPTDTPKDMCRPERAIVKVMSRDISSSWCTDIAFESTNSGYVLQANCDFGIGGGKARVAAKLSGGLKTAFTVETTTTFKEPIRGQSVQVALERWEYRGDCNN